MSPTVSCQQSQPGLFGERFLAVQRSVDLRRRPALQGAVEVGKGLIEPKPIKDIAKDAAPITSEPKSAVFSD